jgi:hypothetical protein
VVVMLAAGGSDRGDLITMNNVKIATITAAAASAGNQRSGVRWR